MVAATLVLGGTWLLYAGASYDISWLDYEASIASRPPCGPALCEFYPLMPGPTVVAISYLVAIPAFLVLAAWFYRAVRTEAVRVGSGVVLAAMGWMAALIAIGVLEAGLLYRSLVWTLFLVSIVVVPIAVLAAGLSFLRAGRSRRTRGRFTDGSEKLDHSLHERGE